MSLLSAAAWPGGALRFQPTTPWREDARETWPTEGASQVYAFMYLSCRGAVRYLRASSFVDVDVLQKNLLFKPGVKMSDAGKHLQNAACDKGPGHMSNFLASLLLKMLLASHSCRRPMVALNAHGAIAAPRKQQRLGRAW